MKSPSGLDIKRANSYACFKVRGKKYHDNIQQHTIQSQLIEFTKWKLYRNQSTQIKINSYKKLYHNEKLSGYAG